jgi:hypothetical protein
MALDEDRSTFEEFGVRGIPHVFVVGADGRLVAETRPMFVEGRHIADLLAGREIDLPSTERSDEVVAVPFDPNLDPEREQRAQELLVLARAALAGSRGIDEVKGLVVEQRMDWEGNPTPSLSSYTLLLPDRFQKRVDSAQGPFAHTVNGADLWQSRLLPAEIVARAEVNVRRQLARKTIEYLAQPSDSPGAQVAGQEEQGDDIVNAIEFQEDGEWLLTLLLDATSHRPRGVRYPDQCGTAEKLLEDYREEGGVLMPFTVRFRCGKHRGVITNTALRVDDPAVTAQQFAQP